MGPEILAIDATGNVYVAGSATGEVLGQESLGNDDAFVAKYNADGLVAWARQFGTSKDDMSKAVAVDQQGNVFVGGVTWGTFPGQTSTEGWNFFLQKFDNAGDELWATQWGPGSPSRLGGTATDLAGNVYVTWTVGNSPSFLRKYDNTGTELWTRESDQYHTSVSVDRSGNVYLLGKAPWFRSVRGPGGALVRKYSTDGQELWVRQFGSDVPTYAAMVVDEEGNSYVAATWGEGFSMEKGDLLIRKYDEAGNEVWTRAVDAPLNVKGMAIDQDANLHLRGTTHHVQMGYNDTFNSSYVQTYYPETDVTVTRELGADASISEISYEGVVGDEQRQVYFVVGFTDPDSGTFVTQLVATDSLTAN